MTDIAQQFAGAAWEVAGRRVAASLDRTSAAVVVSDEPLAAAHAALGIARVQGARRRVVVADLIGEAPPLRELVPTDDPHGITDSFEYGISLDRVTRQVDEAGSLFVIPSGSDPVITGAVLRSDRWRVLADSFAKAGALLLLVAPAQATGVDTLARFVDGAVLVGDTDAAAVAGARVLAVVATPPDAAPAPLITPVAVPLAPAAPDAPDVAPERGVRLPHVASGGRRSRTPLVAGGLLAAALAGWLVLPRLTREPASESGAPPAGSQPASVAAAPSGQAGAGAVSGEQPGALPMNPTTAGPDAARATRIVNPADSAGASLYAVLVSTFPTGERARTRVQRDAPDVPAATVAPVQVPGGQRHQYLAGAYTTRAEADALLRRLRRQAAVGARGGSVVERPLAFLVREGLPRDSAAALVRSYARRGLPVYGLGQTDGTVRLYTGAFVTPEQADLVLAALRRTGVAPALAYRTGRPL